VISQDFLGKNELIDRLSSQVGSRALAISILQKRGHLEKDGKTLTQKGIERDMMTAAERAIDRASKRSNTPKELFYYNQITNRATKNGK